LKLAALFTGGKDSTYAIQLARSMGHEISFLVTVEPESSSSYMFHYPNVMFTALQAESMGIKQITTKTSGEKEAELADLRRLLEQVRSEIEGVLSGAMASSYQRTRVQRLCSELGLQAVSPLWGRDPLGVLEELLDNRFEVVVTAVSAAGLDERWLGRTLDRDAVEELGLLWRTVGVHPCGEGGEFETFVLSCPLFSRRVVIAESVKEWFGDRGILRIKSARLA